MDSKLTLLSQIFKLIPEHIISELCAKHDVKSNAQLYGYKTQLICLLLCHFGQADSVRDVAYAYQGLKEDLGELGIIGEAPSKSAFSYMNRKRSWHFFKDLYLALYNHLFGNKALDSISGQVYALDSTTISLCLKTFNWAHFRSTKGGLKLHTLLELKSCVPAFVHVTTANKHDATQMDKFDVPQDSWIVMDRGYVDYARLNKLNSGGIHFVVRSKENLVFDTVQELTVPKESPEVIFDRLVVPNRTASAEQYPQNLRLVQVKDLETGKEIELLTNNVKAEASLLGQLYRSRWQVENFFKLLKQHLVVKSFIGTNENAVMSQIWSALISILLTKYIQKQAKDKRHFSNTICHLRINLMTRSSLYECLKWPLHKRRTPKKSNKEKPKGQLNISMA